MNWFSPVNEPQRGRERFASPVAVFGMFAAFILLLVVLFPQREILALLQTSQLGNPVAMHYLRALSGIRPTDGDLQLSYAEALVAAGRFGAALPVLDAATAHLPSSRLRHCLELRLVILQGLLQEMAVNSLEYGKFKSEYAATARRLSGSGTSLVDLQPYLGQPRFSGTAEALAFLEGKEETLQNQPAPLAMVDTPESALAAGDYRKSAHLLFDAMDRETSIDRRRQLFLKAIRTLQSGNLLDEALAAADRNIDGLANDRTTLLSLTRLALAANRPVKAQEYVKRALAVDASLSAGSVN